VLLRLSSVHNTRIEIFLFDANTMDKAPIALFSICRNMDMYIWDVKYQIGKQKKDQSNPAYPP
jgi:hypothetical protein